MTVPMGRILGGRTLGAWQVMRTAMVCAVAAMCGLITVLFMLSQPWLPGHFESGANERLDYITTDGTVWREAKLTSTGCATPGLDLRSEDSDTSPDFTDPAARTARLQRLADVRCHLNAPDARLSGIDGDGKLMSMDATVRPRTLGDLGLRFWPPWIIAVATMLLAGAPWALRPKETATRLLALSGLFLMVSCSVIAAWTAYLPGAEPRLFWAMLTLNRVANQIFFLSLLGLFLSYPMPLLKGAWALPFLAIPFALAVALGWLPDWIGGLIIPFCELLGLLGALGWQWHATRRDPRGRAALNWMGLSVAVGAILWLCLLASILITGRTGDAGSILALVVVFPFYLGLAMGVARFCLVELQDWAFRILFFVMAAAVFVAGDAALVALLNVGQGPATGIALLVVAFGYLPLRAMIWRRLFKARTLSRPAMFAAVMEVAFAPTPAARSARWQALLGDLFQPLSTVPAETAPIDGMIVDEGLSLDVPAVAESPALRLSLARGGRELFSPSQLALVRQLVLLVRTAATSRDAYERGAAEERLRLAQDLHDDVGARLLSGLNTADAQTRPLLHAALGDIRAIAGGLAGRAAPLERVLADIRQECVRRFEAAGLETDWPLWPDDAPLILLDYRLHKALASSLREVASNLIRHAGAKHVAVTMRLDGDSLHIRVEDDGSGFSDDALSGERAGQGLAGLQRRMIETRGRARFGNRETGGAWTELVLTLSPTPIAPESPL